MTDPQNHDDFRRAFSALRDAEPPTAARDAVRRVQADGVRGAAKRGESRRWQWRVARPVGLGVAGALVTGTAAAAVTGSLGFGGLATTLSPEPEANFNLAGLLDKLGDTEARSATITREGLAIQISSSDRRICFLAPGDTSNVPYTPVPQGAAESERAMPALTPGRGGPTPVGEMIERRLACFRTAAVEHELPVVSGKDQTRAWATIIVPDGITDLRVTSSDGRTAAPAVDSNIAVASLPGDRPISSVAWTSPTGREHRQALPDGPTPIGK
jgi:hypothetical protein